MRVSDQKRIRELEAENKKLGRQLGRMHRRLNHSIGREMDLEELEEELSKSIEQLRREEEEKNAPAPLTCSCGCAEFIELTPPGGMTLRYCGACKKKQP
jgi:hypothetical protein